MKRIAAGILPLLVLAGCGTETEGAEPESSPASSSSAATAAGDVELVDYPNGVQMAQRVELSSSIPLDRRASTDSIDECLTLLAAEFQNELVTVLVDEGVESERSRHVSGTAQSGSQGATEFFCEDYDEGMELAYHGPV